MDDAVYHFQAINRSPKGISLKWEGKVLGSRIEGKATVSKKGKLKRNTVSAERKRKVARLFYNLGLKHLVGHSIHFSFLVYL